MRSGVIAQKVGMTRIYNDAGEHVPVTVLRMENCQVVAQRTQEKNGYTAVQLGVGLSKVKNTSKALRGHFAAALYIAYDTFMAVRYGRTLGKKWLGLRVANLSDGSNPSVQTALIRAAVLWLPFAFCCACVWTAISGGWSYFDRPYKQGLHDKAARTVVVTAR